MTQEKPKLPEPLECAHCGKAPLQLEPDENGTVYVQCLTKGCITYGDVRWKIRLDLWNSRPDPQTVRGFKLSDLMRLADIGGAFLRHMSMPLNANDEEIMRAMSNAVQLYFEREKRYGYSHEEEAERKRQAMIDKLNRHQAQMAPTEPSKYFNVQSKKKKWSLDP